MKSPTLKVVVAGEPLLGQHVVLLASLLGDHPLAERLELGLAQRNSIVALTTEDREHLIELLGTPPSGLAALHSALLRQRVRLRRRSAVGETQLDVTDLDGAVQMRTDEGDGVEVELAEGVRLRSTDAVGGESTTFRRWLLRHRRVDRSLVGADTLR